MNESAGLINEQFRTRGSRALTKAIFDAEFPEQFIRTLPAQSIYYVLKQNGLGSSLELLGMLTLEQLRFVLDLDLWRDNQLNEDAFWEWLSLVDTEGDFTLLQRELKSLDLKILALIVQRYIEVTSFEEPTENPPATGFYTPDKGYTWIHININDSSRHFYLARFLALVFESSAELFYQILSVPNVATGSVLEEDALEDRNKRLEAEGIPTMERSAEILSLLSVAEATAILEEANNHDIIEGIRGIETLLFDSPCDLILSRILASGGEHAEEELTLVMNSAIVRYKVDHTDPEIVTLMASKIKGALSIGVERLLLTNEERSIEDIYKVLGATKLVRLGLTLLGELFKLTRKIDQDKLTQLAEDPIKFGIIAALRQPFPEAPKFFLEDGSIEEVAGKLTPGYRAISSLKDIENLKRAVEHSLA